MAYTVRSLTCMMITWSTVACFFVVLFHGLQAIDLTKVSQELACLASDVDLVILVGMV